MEEIDFEVRLKAGKKASWHWERTGAASENGVLPLKKARCLCTGVDGLRGGLKVMGRRNRMGNKGEQGDGWL